jgi:hypothetical protein
VCGPGRENACSRQDAGWGTRGVWPEKKPIPTILLSNFARSLDQQIVECGDKTMHQFRVGEVVTCIPDMFIRHAAPGDYRIIALMPDRDGDHAYKIKSPLEEHERVIKESLLVKSEGYLPQEEVVGKRLRTRSITLPTRFNSI